MCSKLNHFLGVARGTERAATAAEGQQIFTVAFKTPYSGEPLVQVAALKIFSDNPGNYRPEKTIRLNIMTVVVLLKFFKVVPKNLPESCLFRSPGTVNRKGRCKLHDPSAQKGYHMELFIHILTAYSTTLSVSIHIESILPIEKALTTLPYILNDSHTHQKDQSQGKERIVQQK